MCVTTYCIVVMQKAEVSSVVKSDPKPISEAGKLFLHIHDTCFPSINSLQQCRRIRGVQDQKCRVLADSLWECYSRAVCPVRYEKAKACVLSRGLPACELEKSELADCSRTFSHWLANPKVVQILRNYSATEANCQNERADLRECIVGIQLSKKNPKECELKDEMLKDCYLRHLFPEPYTKFLDCLSNNNQKLAKCSEESKLVDEAFSNRANMLLEALDFAPDEIHGPNAEDYQQMVFSVLGAAATESHDEAVHG